MILMMIVSRSLSLFIAIGTIQRKLDRIGRDDDLGLSWRYDLCSEPCSSYPGLHRAQLRLMEQPQQRRRARSRLARAQHFRTNSSRPTMVGFALPTVIVEASRASANGTQTDIGRPERVHLRPWTVQLNSS